MNRLDIIRKTKALFMKWNAHRLLAPLSGVLDNAAYMAALSKWRKEHPVKGYNDFYQSKWDYNRRFRLYEAILEQEQLADTAIDYLEFGVASGSSFKWWLAHNTAPSSRFYGFDTFEGLPEKWGGFDKGAMAHAMESLHITDTRVSFYKGLFQETLLPFLQNYQGNSRRVVHIDSDLFTAALFTLTQLYPYLKAGDIIIFDEFAVPTHEFLAFKLFSESFYIRYEVVAAANNYLFLAIKLL